MNGEVFDMLDRVMVIILEKRQPYLELMRTMPGDSWALRVTNAMTELHNTILDLQEGDAPQIARPILGWLLRGWASMWRWRRFNSPVVLHGPGSPRVYIVRLESASADGFLKVLKTPGIPALGSENPDLPGVFCVDREVEMTAPGLFKVTATYGPKPGIPEVRSLQPAASATPGSNR